MSEMKGLPIALAMFVAAPLLISLGARPSLENFAAAVVPVQSDKPRFEATATVQSIEVVCSYSKWLIRTSGPKLTGFIPCVPKEEIAEHTGTHLNEVSFSKFTVAVIEVRETGLPPREGYVITQNHYVGGDPMASGKTQDRFKDLTFKPGDRISVSYRADERDPKRDTFFQVAHLD